MIRSARGGCFTLVELLVSLAIFSMLFIPLMALYLQGFKNFNQGSAIQESLVGASVLMRQMKKDFKAASVVGRADGPGGFRIQVESDGRLGAISFPVFSGIRVPLSPGQPPTAPLLGRVEYRLDPDGGQRLGKKFKVTRRFTPARSDTANPPTEHIVARNILRLQVTRYLAFDTEFFRLAVTGYTGEEAAGAGATAQLFCSVGVRYFNSRNFDPFWQRVQQNRPVLGGN